MGYGMNDLPSDWSEQLQSVYPKRSGPSGWRSTKLMLALRRALFDSTWEQIIDGCKNYRKYCQAGGIEGSTFVQAPARYIEEGSYLETFAFQAAEDPKKAESRRVEGEHMQRAVERAVQAGSALRPYPQESAAAFETRIRMEATRQPSVRPREELDGRIRDLANHLRVAK
jgi:hypothetical protein